MNQNYTAKYVEEYGGERRKAKIGIKKIL